MSSATLSPPLKFHGGKSYLASRIIALMPPHIHYVEPFAGGLAVLLAKNPHDVSEVVNDANGWLTNFWRVLADPELFPQFQRFIEATPFSEAVFVAARDVISKSKLPESLDPVMAAAWFFVCCRQSLAGRMESFAPTSRNRTRRQMNEQVSAWLTSIDGLAMVHRRLIRVLVRTGPAEKVIKSEDGSNTLQYWDPTYFPDTRTSPKAYGEYEMTVGQHESLLNLGCQCESKILISGYDCELYRKLLKNWNRHDFDLPNNAAGGDSKRRMTECVWCNF